MGICKAGGMKARRTNQIIKLLTTIFIIIINNNTISILNPSVSTFTMSL